nr:GTP-binding protein [Devosia sp. MC1541]
MGKSFVFDSAEPPTLAVLGQVERSAERGTEPVIIADDRFATVEWEWEGEVDTGAFQTCIEALAPQLVRAKGILNLSRSRDVSYNFNLVGRRASMSKLAHRQNTCQLVLIGEREHFDPEAARSLLFQTFADLKVVSQNG